MTSQEIRNQFIEFFKNKGHYDAGSAPIVIKNDPTLMFTNAGMNQFKDIFLGNKQVTEKRAVNLQKCLRVSGKHNDLEEVGVDHYHHTMFEMMGNWSFGDYFKKEAIEWAWELITQIYKIPKEDIYVSIFEGDDKLGVGLDEEAKKYWLQFIPEDRILAFDAKDNFWEMGETGPCGPCSEIHVDLRSADEKAKVPGAELVNADHPNVIEIWNLVFIQFNRKKDGSLQALANKHIDTGMGFERLVRILQLKDSNYDTDIFTPILQKIESIANLKYEGTDSKKDIAFRVIADHIRTISFTINDGQLPSNTGAGYVIRRVLRRAVRYAYSFLNIKTTFLAELVDVLINQFKTVYPEFFNNKTLIKRVITEEEQSFLRTLEAGLKRFATIENGLDGKVTIEGTAAFELFDTYGFPIDLTRLLAVEKGLKIDETGFNKALNEQKERARAASKIDASDWVIVNETKTSTEFTGYVSFKEVANIIKYRSVETKKKKMFQVVLDKTPFYAEAGGQVGDTGLFIQNDKKIKVVDTQKENDLILHFLETLPENIEEPLTAAINTNRRNAIIKNHTATHLLQAALQETLGNHIQQKGSMVNDKGFRFDFSHFSKLEEEELLKAEQIVNQKVRENIEILIETGIPIEAAKAKGAMALFGEKYDDLVRVVTIDPKFSIELCGGTHVKATGEIGYCKLTLETSVAAGVRRIEAITGVKASDYIVKQAQETSAIKNQLKASGSIAQAVEKVLTENTQLKKQVEQLQMQQASQIKESIKNKLQQVKGANFAALKIDAGTAEVVKKISFDLKREVENLFLVLAANTNGKAHLSIMIDEKLAKANNWDAGKLIKEWSKHIQGGGGGQAHYATAGGKSVEGIGKTLAAANALVMN